MSIIRCVSRFALVAFMALPAALNAAVVLPALDIQDVYSDDAGASVSTNSFTIDATAFQIITGGDPVDIADEVFTLTSTSGYYDPAADGGLGYGVFGGTFSIGTDILSGSFSSLEVFGYGNGISFDFAGDLVFDYGSMKGGFDGGRIEGAIEGDIVIAKLGTVTVVPVPAAVWLFGSGLLGLVAVARRKS